MVKFINKWTGSEMWVAEDRVEEYKAAGHKLAVTPIVSVPQKPKAKPAVQKTTKKTRK